MGPPHIHAVIMGMRKEMETEEAMLTFVKDSAMFRITTREEEGIGRYTWRENPPT